MDRKRILIIEDNPMYLNMLKIRLELHGYETVLAKEGVEGLTLARTQKPDLILLDLALPEIGVEIGDDEAVLNRLDRSGGHKICRLIKFDQTLKDIPIVILTASDSEEDHALARRMGADAYVVKTDSVEALISTIEKLI